MVDSFAQPIFCMLRFHYTYLGESIGLVVTGVGWFGDRYLDGFLGVASLILTCVLFLEHRCRKDDLCLLNFGLTGECVAVAVGCAQTGKTAHM